MIDRDRFAILAGAMSCGEANPVERAEFDAALCAEPTLASEWEQADIADFALRRAILPSPGDAIPLPPSSLARVESARLGELAARATNEAKTSGAANVVAFQPGVNPERSTGNRRWFAAAAAVALLASLGTMWFSRPGPPEVQASAALAPRGETGVMRPILVWDARPGQRYDVWILPAEGTHMEAPALWTAKSVLPPLDFSELIPSPTLTAASRPTTRLEAGMDYRILVCLADAGRIAGVAVPFRTTAGAIKSLPAASLPAARQLAASGRPADALMLLTQLPTAERNRPEAQILQRELRSRLSR